MQAAASHLPNVGRIREGARNAPAPPVAAGQRSNTVVETVGPRVNAGPREADDRGYHKPESIAAAKQLDTSERCAERRAKSADQSSFGTTETPGILRTVGLPGTPWSQYRLETPKCPYTRPSCRAVISDNWWKTRTLALPRSQYQICYVPFSRQEELPPVIQARAAIGESR
jgi:hypothetical protein